MLTHIRRKVDLMDIINLSHMYNVPEYYCIFIITEMFISERYIITK